MKLLSKYYYPLGYKVGICSVLLIIVFTIGACLAYGQIPITPATTGDCDSSYPDFCIPSSQQELNCTDIPKRALQFCHLTCKVLVGVEMA